MTRDEGLALFDGINESIARVEQTNRTEMLGLRAWLDEKFKSVAKDGENADKKILELKEEREGLEKTLKEAQDENKGRDRLIRIAGFGGAGVGAGVMYFLKLLGIIHF